MRPRPLSDGGREAGTHGILDDVAAGRLEVFRIVDRTGREASSEERAEALVTAVESLCVPAEEPLQPTRELGLGRVENEVVVRRQQAERLQRPAVMLRAEEDLSEKRAPIVVITKDRAAVDAARHDVEVAVGERRSQDSGHPTM